MFTELINKTKSIVVWMLLGFLPLIGGLVGQPDAEFFALMKPEFFPPTWSFGVVWMILYAHIGFAAYMAYGKLSFEELLKSCSLKFFLLHLVLNTLWTIIFFTFASPILALVDIILLLVVVGLWLSTMDEEGNKLSAVVALPYFTWLLFATILNISIITLN